MKSVLVVLVLAVAVLAQNPTAKKDPYVGTFQGDGVILELAGSGGEYSGTISWEGQKMSTKVKASGGTATGAVDYNGQSYTFTLTPAGAGFKLASEGREYNLERKTEAQ